MLARAAPGDADFAAFHARWQGAVARGDAAAVAALTRLPFRFEGRLHGAEGFVRTVWPRLFDARLRRCVAERAPQAEGADRVLVCPPYALYFSAGPEGWRLREFGADGESAQ